MSDSVENVEIVVNGNARNVATGTSVAQLIASLNVSGAVAVERNREIVPRAKHATTILVDGDRLELVTFVGGGQ